MNGYILMADIVKSSLHSPLKLVGEFKQLVSHLNSTFKSDILSPMTITLGDEFQGVVISANAGCKIILAANNWLIAKSSTIKLRYVLYEGVISTPINKKQAYEMLGDGLTNARKLLNESKTNKETIHIQLKNRKKSRALAELFFNYERIYFLWHKKDFTLINALINNNSYSQVAAELGKDRSLIWRREKSLRMTEYKNLCSLILYIA